MILKKQRKIKGLALILMMTVIPLILTALPTIFDNIEQKDYNESQFDSISNPQLSLPASNYEWWNKSWSFRIPIGIMAVGSQQNAPVELLVNFTKYFNDINIQNPLLNTSSIRVIEYTSISNYYEVDCQFDPYKRSYNNQSNAIGDMIWILNGSTNHGLTRDFYIYFNNGSSSEIPEPNYDKIRLWHEGFEEYQTGDIFAPTDGQDIHPSSWHVSNTTSARGRSSLRIWGNCWKESNITDEVAAYIDSNTIVTAKIRFDDPDIYREISGIGFTSNPAVIPASGNSYNIRGHQDWGSAGTPSYQYRNVYYADNTFFWYTLDDLPLSFKYIFYVADDDGYTDLNLYWDDISIWDKTVQTTPNNSLQTEIGNMQAISFSLKITCKDEQGNRIQNAHIFITNSTNPSLNQDNYSESNGEWIFTDLVKNGLYNITINYTQNGLSTPMTKSVYYHNNYQITDLNNYLDAYINITTINFGVLDKDNDPIQYGYVLLKEGATNVGKGTLSDTGNCTIRWVNDTNYAYEVYFDYSILPDLSTYRYDVLEIDSGSVNIGTHIISSFTQLSKVNLNVTQYSDGSAFAGAKLRFYNTTDYPNENDIIANITIGMDGIIRFISFSNETIGDWGNYTLEVYFGGSTEWVFYANGESMVDYNYNFSMNIESNISIEIDINRKEYNSTISFISITSDIFWRDSVSIEFNFTKQDPVNTSATLVTPSELYMQILDDEQMPFSDKVDILSFEVSTGVFNYIFNTTQLSLIGGIGYWIEITGNYKSYVPPDELRKSFEVQALPTGLTIYDYSLIELENNEISEYYNELVNITVKYYNINTGALLEGATLSYSWDYGSGAIISDPIHSGYYYFEIDTSDSPNIGKYRIELTAMLENYTTTEELMDVNILRRPTSINGTTTLLQISPEIYIRSAHNFSFEYRDVRLNEKLGDLDVVNYYWYKLDDNGDPLSGPGNEGIGDLIQGTDDLYILDFDTESREVADYTIFITLQKNNHEVRNAFISLSIRKRPINVSLSATNLVGKHINVVKGTPIEFSLILQDPTNNSALLIGATVFLTINNANYSFTEVSAGTYTVTFTTNHIDAFFMPQTLTDCQISIKKNDYEIDSIDIVIVIGMDEVFPGMPMFYFLMLVGAIVAVVGSLVAYRQIQRARIPTFVKKVKAMSKDIKGRKSISESLLYPSKEEFIVKKLGEKWEVLGLSLEDILGIDTKKKKKLPESTDIKGGAF